MWSSREQIHIRWQLAIKQSNKPQTLQPLLENRQKKLSIAQITQTLKFRFAQDMGHHSKNILWPLTNQNPSCTLCHNKHKDTWPHLLSTCKNPLTKGLRIAWHNQTIHLISQTLQASKNTWFFTLINACNHNNKPPDHIVPNWLLKCTCAQATCHCQAKSRLDILCITGVPNQIQTSISPFPTLTVQLIQFTSWHDRFPDQAFTQKHTK